MIFIQSFFTEKTILLIARKWWEFFKLCSPIIVTDNEKIYDKLLSGVGKNIDPKNCDYAVYKRNLIQTGGSAAYTYSYNYGKQFSNISMYEYHFYEESEILDCLASTFLNTSFKDGWDEGNILVTSGELEEYFKKYTASYHTGKELGYSADLFDLSKSKKYEVFTKN